MVEWLSESWGGDSVEHRMLGTVEDMTAHCIDNGI